MDDSNFEQKRTITVYATPQNVHKCIDDLAEVLIGSSGRFEVTVLDVTADPTLIERIEDTPTVVIEAPGFLGVIIGANSADTIRSGLGIRQG